MKNKLKNIFGVIIISLLWISLSLASWFSFPQEFSITERRKLAQFPSPSLQKIFNGKFMSDFEGYALDQFLFRDNFRKLKALSLYSIFFKRILMVYI